MRDTVYLYVTDTMADWEVGYLTAELNSGRYFKKGAGPLKIVTVGIEKTPVITMGGLKIVPDIQLEECSLENTAALILPGADTWLDKIHEPIIKMAEKCINANIVVAAICGATIGLAGNGLLNSKLHTSNDLGFIKMVCPNYKGDKYYINEPAVADGKLITASGEAPLEFTVQVLKALEVFSSRTLDVWYKLYETHEPEYFYELMASIR